MIFLEEVSAQQWVRKAPSGHCSILVDK